MGAFLGRHLDLDSRQAVGSTRKQSFSAASHASGESSIQGASAVAFGETAPWKVPPQGQSANAHAAEVGKYPRCASFAYKRVLTSHSRAPHRETHRLAKRRYCGTLTPTEGSKAKIERCTKTGIEFFCEQLH